LSREIYTVAESVTFSFDFQEEAPQIRTGNFQDFADLLAGETLLGA